MRERGIIIQLSVLCRAELTRTEADFLLLTHPSATSPCRKREEEEGNEGKQVGWRERETHTHARQIIQNTHIQHRRLHVALTPPLVR